MKSVKETVNDKIHFFHRQEIMVVREWGGRQFETFVLNEFLREFLVALA